MTDYRWGPRRGNGGTRFRLWAPGAQQVTLERDGQPALAMQAQVEGWWEVACDVATGARYRFRIGETLVPDPASRRQDGDAHGWSIVTDGAYAWRNNAWQPRPWHEAVISEVHVGLAGGFRKLAEQLDNYAETGITAIELMPVNDFPGRRNWGYDGVLPFAPDEAYGTPEDLKFLIDEAHGRGLMVFLDVVYNHFGPDGNYLPQYAPQFFRNDQKTPWGDAIDFRRSEVQSFFIENALYWLGEFRFDGLRFDAVHAIHDPAFLQQLGHAIRAEFPSHHLILENEDNAAGLLDIYTAQWNDDFHNTMHVLLTGETAGYYADFAPDGTAKLARLLREGFAFQGEYAGHIGQERGQSSEHLPTTAFVSFLQNHDQIGNRALGERLITLMDEPALKAAVVLQLLCPQIPLLFMGEEAGARKPFLFFTDYQDPALAEAVREGRAAEFARFPAFASGEIHVPDPNALETFERCHLGPGDPVWRAFYQTLLNLRRTLIVPRLKGTIGLDARAIGDKAVLAVWRLGDNARLTIATNLSGTPVRTDLPNAKPIYGEAQGGTVAPFTTLVWIES